MDMVHKLSVVTSVGSLMYRSHKVNVDGGCYLQLKGQLETVGIFKLDAWSIVKELAHLERKTFFSPRVISSPAVVLTALCWLYYVLLVRVKCTTAT